MVQALLHRGPDGPVACTCLAPRSACGGWRLSTWPPASSRSRTRPATSTSSPTARSTTSSSCATNSERRDTGSRRGRPTSSRWSTPGKNGARRFRRACAGCSQRSIWDARTRTLFAARDRAGEKPLYWTSTDRGLLLGSEVKALLTRPEVSRALDLESLDQFLTFEYVIAPRTMFRAFMPCRPDRGCARVTAPSPCSATGIRRRSRCRLERRRRRRRGARGVAARRQQPADVGGAAWRVPVWRHRLEQLVALMSQRRATSR